MESAILYRTPRCRSQGTVRWLTAPLPIHSDFRGQSIHSPAGDPWDPFRRSTLASLLRDGLRGDGGADLYPECKQPRETGRRSKCSRSTLIRCRLRQLSTRNHRQAIRLSSTVLRPPFRSPAAIQDPGWQFAAPIPDKRCRHREYRLTLAGDRTHKCLRDDKRGDLRRRLGRKYVQHLHGQLHRPIQLNGNVSERGESPDSLADQRQRDECFHPRCDPSRALPRLRCQGGVNRHAGDGTKRERSNRRRRNSDLQQVAFLLGSLLQRMGLPHPYLDIGSAPHVYLHRDAERQFNDRLPVRLALERAIRTLAGPQGPAFLLIQYVAVIGWRQCTSLSSLHVRRDDRNPTVSAVRRTDPWPAGTAPPRRRCRRLNGRPRQAKNEFVLSGVSSPTSRFRRAYF